MKLSVACIVKNESKNLRYFLPLVEQFADEIVIVDTGSSREEHNLLVGSIMERLVPITLDDFIWNDNFSDARNHALSLCSGDYVMMLDPDMRMEKETVRYINEEFKPNLDGMANAVYLGKMINHEQNNAVRVHRGIRCFPVRSDIRFKYHVHEDISEDALKAGLNFADSKITVHHFNNESPKDYSIKVSRYMGLIQKDIEDYGEIPRNCAYLALSFFSLGDHQKCAEWGEKCLTNKSDDIWARLVMCQVATSYFLTNATWKANEWMERIALAWPDDGMVRYYLAELYMRCGRYDDAAHMFLKAAELKLSTDCIPIPSDINEILVMNLGRCLRLSNQHEKAHRGYMGFLKEVTSAA
jgi:glycosyltransferase involved in cell wall biosynthesis